MDKKMLRQIPRPETKPEYIKLAEKMNLSTWLLHVSVIDGIMQVTAWAAEELRKGKGTGPRFRFFFGEDDYITQDLSVGNTKWLTGKLYNVLRMGYWDFKTSSIVFVNDESQQLFEERFTPEARSWWGSKEHKTGFVTLDNWQEIVLRKRLKERHDRELAHTNEMMALVSDIPEGFEAWIHDYGMRSRRYLVYDGNSKIRIRSAFCTECGQYMEIDSKNVRLRMNEWGECPCCGSPVYMKTIKRWHEHEVAQNNVAIVQKLDDGRLLFRCFAVYYDFKKSIPPLLHIEKKQSVYEYRRVFIDGKRWEAFEYAEYKQSHRIVWCPDTGENKNYDFIIQREGLREKLAGTPYQYSGLEVYQEKEEFRPIPVFDFLHAYEKCNELETLVKAGLTRLVSESIHNILYWHHERLSKELKLLTKPHLRMLRDLNGGMSMVNVFREIELVRKDISESDVRVFIDTFGSSQQILHTIFMHDLSVGKFSRYVQKQTGRCKKGSSVRANFIHDWNDYTAWCQELGYDMKDPYVLMPPDFKKAHDRVFKELQDHKDAELRKAMEELDKVLRVQMETMSGVDPMHMATKKFLIRLPESVEELKQEGKTLHHCVATYADRVAKGETIILFVRKVESPDEPFFTMEWRDNKVIQCRGSHNCAMPNDVKTFVTAFERKMHEIEEKGDKRLKVRAS